jgi:ATP-binding cassette, subfamily B, bacterial PglK
MIYLKKTWRILNTEYKKKVFFLVLLIFCTVVLEVLGIGLIIPLVIFFLEDDISSKYPFLISIVSIFFNNPQKADLITFSLISILIIYFIKNLLLSTIAFFETRFSFGVHADVQKRLFEYYINQDLSFHSKKNTANLINNTTKEISVLFHLIMHSVTLFSEIFIFFGISMLLAIYQPLAFFSIGIISAIVVLVFHILTKKKLISLGEKRQREDELIIQKIQQGLGGIRELKIYNRELDFRDLFFESSNNIFNIQWKSQFIQKLPKPILEYSTVFAMIVVVFIFIKLGYSSSYIVTVLALFGVAAVRVLPSLVRIFNSSQAIQFGIPALNIIYSELSNVKNKKIIKKTNLTKALKFDSHIKVENITFKYPGSNNSIFEGINLEIPKGKLIGIQGASGSGKSTLIDIILGLIQPTEGKVLVDGFEVAKDILSWQKNLSYVPQNVFLTDDSLKRNIAFGLKETEISTKKIYDVIKAAELDKFVNSLPKKLDTVVGERGARISGGQRQRIGLARALYHEPELLVLDETTSSLEKETEEKIMKTVSRIQNNKTIIIVSHDKELLSNCEIIYLINEKKIKKIN